MATGPSRYWLVMVLMPKRVELDMVIPCRRKWGSIVFVIPVANITRSPVLSGRVGVLLLGRKVTGCRWRR